MGAFLGLFICSRKRSETQRQRNETRNGMRSKKARLVRAFFMRQCGRPGILLRFQWPIGSFSTVASHGLAGLGAIRFITCGLTGLHVGWMAKGPAQPSLECDAVCSFFRSKFKAPKTPPSHGLTGFVAIESVAKNDGFQGRGRRPKQLAARL